MARHIALVLLSFVVTAPAQVERPPNIVYVLADDLGWGELGCYGQRLIRTPSIDRLAAEGMRFLRHYSGSPVCAPSRCVLLTGRSSPTAEIRDNREVKPEGQHALTSGAVTIAELLGALGYRTGAVGKWGLGPPGSTGDPVMQGFDLFFGYNCQRQAHNYFPRHLWRNEERVAVANREFRAHQKLKSPPASFDGFRGELYAPDLMIEEALDFIRSNAERPFFLYLPFVEPHLAMQPPPRLVETYPTTWDDEPYLGTRGYLPHPRPRAGYAAMITHLDEHVGRVCALLDELGLRENTLVMFSSDNGPTHDVGGVDTAFFRSAGPFRGRKGSLLEGGIRVPMIARWPGRIAAGSTTTHLSAFQDVLPTLVEAAGGGDTPSSDGISFLPTLLGRDDQGEHPQLTWEFHGYGGWQAARDERWKLVRRGLARKPGAFQLFELRRDLAETHDVATENPAVVRRLAGAMRRRDVSDTFPLPALDSPASPSRKN